MKGKFFTLKMSVFFALTFCVNSLLVAQTPEKISYQSVLRGSDNELLANKRVGMKVSILKGSANGTVVYTQTKSTMTNANGLINLKIGDESIFSNIDWGSGVYYIKTETDPTGGANYTISGESQLLSVPYALHAKTTTSESLKYDKAGGKINGPVSVGIDLPSGHLFNVFDNLKILDDEAKAVIIGNTVNSAGARHRVYHEDYNWKVPEFNPGMIGDYADLYLHQVETAPSTVAANESYTNISTAAGVTNAGRQIGYLGGVMIMSGHKGIIEHISGAKIANRIRPNASGNIGSMAGVQGGLTSYGTNTAKIQEFRALESFTYALNGARLVDNYGLYLRSAMVPGVTRGWGVYQEGSNDNNYFAGKVRIGHVLGSDIPVSDYKLDVLGSSRFSAGVEVGAFKSNGNINIVKQATAEPRLINFRIGDQLRYSTQFLGAEEGGLSGSNITMYRYDDAGAYLGKVYNINRATGTVEIEEELKAKTVKLKKGTLNQTPQPGTLEYDGSDLYFTNESGIRKKIN
ncbi:hypothetical protein [Kaistella antarctica]|uniref:Uncharacterized protein n=1 Tax=Kaistella antarctica TaxID=266748 RepID=A0A3S4UZS1_9FLAO|nr:hypothetical protein [Kaistella antarctica]SEV84657.1 hypothetical protein SAMN05421765_0675 [Kaistella antarctica]VEI01006.1 Uncharacterised protein [Kaistella antarctica]